MANNRNHITSPPFSLRPTYKEDIFDSTANNLTNKTTTTTNTKTNNNNNNATANTNPTTGSNPYTSLFAARRSASFSSLTLSGIGSIAGGIAGGIAGMGGMGGMGGVGTTAGVGVEANVNANAGVGGTDGDDGDDGNDDDSSPLSASAIPYIYSSNIDEEEEGEEYSYEETPNADTDMENNGNKYGHGNDNGTDNANDEQFQNTMKINRNFNFNSNRNRNGHRNGHRNRNETLPSASDTFKEAATTTTTTTSTSSNGCVNVEQNQEVWQNPQNLQNRQKYQQQHKGSTNFSYRTHEHEHDHEHDHKDKYNYGEYNSGDGSDNGINRKQRNRRRALKIIAPNSQLDDNRIANGNSNKHHGRGNKTIRRLQQQPLRQGLNYNSTLTSSSSSSISTLTRPGPVLGGIGGSFSVRITTSTERIDASGAKYTAYIMCVKVKTNNNDYHYATGTKTNNTNNTNNTNIHSTNSTNRTNVEHRYSQFAKLNNDLRANGIYLQTPFPSRHWAGRIGDWTPASYLAQNKAIDLIRYREKMLDLWVVELCQLYQQSGSSNRQHSNNSNLLLLHEELRSQVELLWTCSSTEVPPCDWPNHISWGLWDGNEEKSVIEFDGGETERTDGITTNALEARPSGGSIVMKHLGNPVSFTLGSCIRQAAYIIMRMCGTKSTYTLFNGDESDRLIPLSLLHRAKGLCFLTVVKAGFVVSARVGTGLIISKKRDGSWSPPSAVGTFGLGWGALVGGDITNYLIVLNTESAVRGFAQRRSIHLGAELDVAVGPGRGANGNLSAHSSGIVPAYAYAHSNGLFAGISLEGSIVGCRPDVNAKFYGKAVDAQDLLFEHIQRRPLAARPLYDALDEAMSLEVPKKGFRPMK